MNCIAIAHACTICLVNQNCGEPVKKTDEIKISDSCFNRALDDELIFVLLGRDVAAPAAIRMWIQERVRLGKNSMTDNQVESALQLANKIEGANLQLLWGSPTNDLAAIDAMAVALATSCIDQIARFMTNFPASYHVYAHKAFADRLKKLLFFVGR